MYQDTLCFKTEYGIGEAFNEAGEAFWGGAQSEHDRKLVVVQPVTMVLKTEE